MIDLGKSIIKFVKTPFVWVVFFLFLNLAQTQAQYTIPEKPKSDASLVFDYTDGAILNAGERAQLNRKLINYEAKTGTQIAVILLNDLQGEDINYLGAKWGQKWGIGQEKSDNGLVIMLSKDDRKIALQNGYGLEEYLTDARSRQIIDQFFIPHLRQGEYYEAFDQGSDAVMRLLEGKFVEDGNGYEQSEGIPLWMLLLFLAGILLFLYIITRGGGGGRGGGNRHRTSPFGDVIFTDFGRSTWVGGGSGGFGSGGGFGGGGFGGFGGGGFGGGGASGSW